MTAEIVNLNQFRKERQRADKEKTAAASRHKHGRTKAERRAETKKRDLDDRHLDGHQRDDGDD